MFSRREFLFSVVLPLMQNSVLLKETKRGLWKWRWLEGEVEGFGVKIEDARLAGTDSQHTYLQITLTNKGDSFAVFDLKKLIFVCNEKQHSVVRIGEETAEIRKMFGTLRDQLDKPPEPPLEPLDIAPKASREITVVLDGGRSDLFNPKHELRLYYDRKPIEVRLEVDLEKK